MRVTELTEVVAERTRVWAGAALGVCGCCVLGSLCGRAGALWWAVLLVSVRRRGPAGLGWGTIGSPAWESGDWAMCGARVAYCLGPQLRLPAGDHPLRGARPAHIPEGLGGALPTSVRSPPVTPARAHSLRPGHPAQQQLTAGRGGEAGVEAGMRAGGEGGGPSEGAEVGEGPVERRPDENRGTPRWEERQAERLREAERKRGEGT